MAVLTAPDLTCAQLIEQSSPSGYFALVMPCPWPEATDLFLRHPFVFMEARKNVNWVFLLLFVEQNVTMQLLGIVPVVFSIGRNMNVIYADSHLYLEGCLD